MSRPRRQPYLPNEPLPPAKERDFFRLVRRYPESKGGHWHYTKEDNRFSYTIHYSDNTSKQLKLTPSRIMIFYAFHQQEGKIPPGVRYYKLCNHERCCRPEHFALKRVGEDPIPIADLNHEDYDVDDEQLITPIPQHLVVPMPPDPVELFHKHHFREQPTMPTNKAVESPELKNESSERLRLQLQTAIYSVHEVLDQLSVAKVKVQQGTPCRDEVLVSILTLARAVGDLEKIYNVL